MFEYLNKVGKKFVPKIGHDWSRVDFVEVIFPEIVWIGFVLHRHDGQKGIVLVTTLIEAASHAAMKHSQPIISSRNPLPPLVQQTIAC